MTSPFCGRGRTPASAAASRNSLTRCASVTPATAGTVHSRESARGTPHAPGPFRNDGHHMFRHHLDHAQIDFLLTLGSHTHGRRSHPKLTDVATVRQGWASWTMTVTGSRRRQSVWQTGDSGSSGPHSRAAQTASVPARSAEPADSEPDEMAPAALDLFRRATLEQRDTQNVHHEWAYDRYNTRSDGCAARDLNPEPAD
jgi:hypothetical protein